MPIAVTCPNCSSLCTVTDSTIRIIDCPLCATSFRVGTVGPIKQTLLLPAASAETTMPSVVGRYQVKEKLGAGAFGAVYRAYDPQLDRDVALKLLKPEALGSLAAVERFRREARAAAKMLHAHVVPVYDYGEHEGTGYIASAFIEGKSLAQSIPEAGTEAKAAARLVAQLLDALAYAHERGVIHRDVKPANCLVDRKGHLYLTDFGLAGSMEAAPTRLTQMGAVMGTPAYMAPEQAAGTTSLVGPHSDLYSAGVVLYEMLTGRVPFEGPTEVVLFNVIGTEPPRPTSLRPGLSPVLEVICLKAMAKKPEGRFADAAVFAAALRDWLAGSKVESAPKPAAPARQAPPRGPERGAVVCQRGSGTHGTIREAVRAAPAGSRILIRPGVYRESITLDKAIVLEGDGPPGTVAVESADEPCLLAIAAATARGLTLRRARGERGKEGYAVEVRRGEFQLERCDVSSDSLTCVGIWGPESNPTVRDCRIHDGKEAGVLVYQKGRGRIEGCEIFANQLAGVEVTQGGEVTVRDCKIRDNEETGLVVCQQGRGTVEGCDVFANKIAGLRISEGGDPTVRDCRIHGSAKGRGVYVHQNGRGTLEGCEVFANNQTGVTIGEGGDPTLRDCKIHDNEGDGILVHKQGRGRIEGGEIFANKFSGVEVREGGDLAARDCQIHDNQGGLFIHGRGRATVEGCKVFTNKLAGVEVSEGGEAAVKDCTIRDNEGQGMLVRKQARVTIEGGEIVGNRLAGVEAREAGEFAVRRCQLSGNRVAVEVGQNGRATVERCDVRGNKFGTWDFEAGCTTTLSENRE